MGRFTSASTNPVPAAVTGWAVLLADSDRPQIRKGAVIRVGAGLIALPRMTVAEAEDLLDEACDTVAVAVEKALAEGVRDVESLERDVRRAAGKFVNERTKRRPMIVPVVMET